jgi:hypothetical protein
MSSEVLRRADARAKAKIAEILPRKIQKNTEDLPQDEKDRINDAISDIVKALTAPHPE